MFIHINQLLLLMFLPTCRKPRCSVPCYIIYDHTNTLTQVYKTQ